MIIAKQVIDINETNRQVIEQIRKQEAKIKNPINEFFGDYQQLQKKIKEQNEEIMKQRSDIHFLTSQQGLQDKYSMMKKQILRSEGRCVNLQNKLFQLQETNNKLTAQLKDYQDQNEALKIKNESLELYLREYEKKVKDYEHFDFELQKNSQESKDSEKLCQSCSKIGIQKRQQSLDLADSFIGNNFFDKSMSCVQKSQSLESNNLKSMYNQNLSKTSINQFDAARLMERSYTVQNKNSQSVFETDIRLNRSHTFKAEYKSDKILNSLNLQSQRKALKFQDCSIYQVEESRDQSNLAIINGKAELKVVNSSDLKEFQQLSNINNSVTEAIKYSSLNNFLISGGQDKSVTVYQYSNNQQYKTKTKLLGHIQTVKAVQFHKITNDTKIISGSHDQTVRIWDIQQEAQSLFVRVGSKVNTVDSFNFSNQIICGHNDGSIKLLQDKNIINNIYLEGLSISHVQVSQDDNYALAANQDGLEITLIDLRMFKILQTFQNINYVNTSSYNKPTFAFNDKYIVAGSNDGDICNLKLNNKKFSISILYNQQNRYLVNRRQVMSSKYYLNRKKCNNTLYIIQQFFSKAFYNRQQRKFKYMEIRMKFANISCINLLYKNFVNGTQYLFNTLHKNIMLLITHLPFGIRIIYQIINISDKMQIFLKLKMRGFLIKYLSLIKKILLKILHNLLFYQNINKFNIRDYFLNKIYQKIKMIEETIKDSVNKGANLWEKVKIKIKAVQSFLMLQNDKKKQEDSILNKRRNPFQDEDYVDQNQDQDFDQAVCKKLRDNNGDPKDQIIEDQYFKTQSSNNQMEVLNEGSQGDNLLNDDYLNNNNNLLDQNEKNQVLMLQNSNQSNQDLNQFAEDNQDEKNYSTSNLKGIYKEQSSQDFRFDSSQMSFNYDKDQNKTNNKDLNKISKMFSLQNNGENYNEQNGIQVQQQNSNQENENDEKSDPNQQDDDKYEDEELIKNDFEQNDDENNNLDQINSNENEENNIFQDNQLNKTQEGQGNSEYYEVAQNEALYQLFGTQSIQQDKNEENEQQQQGDQNENDDEWEDESEEGEGQKDNKDYDNEEEEEDYDDYDEEEEDQVDENVAQDDQSKQQRQYEDSLVKQENIFVNDAIVEEDKTDNMHSQGTNNISFELNDQENIINIKICSREYRIDLNKEIVKNNEKLVKIINDMADLIEQLKAKQNEKIQELMKITDHNQFTALEYYLMKTIDEIFKQERGIQNQKWQEEICCICQCDLFENIDQYSQEDFLKQLQNSSDEDPINLAHCESHFFHKSCLKMMIQSTYIKCPVCSKIYGIMIGDQPPGTMSIYLDKYSFCDGYPNKSTIVIEMNMNSTTKNGNYVPPTSRVGYLPNTEEARKILEMFKIAFKRRLLYTIGKSVTTGKDNRIIWNGVHFKTNIYGGSSNFGYPDPTYFQRVTQELSLKGIYPKD
ncbi:hypothetical protein ABPG74_012535 [Tetrahymena malaccensis]